MSDEELDHPLRAVVVVNSPDVPEGDMEERLLDTIQSFEAMNQFFDAFDETVAVPNDGHIKYEVGSDGLVVMVVDTMALKATALEFMDQYEKKANDKDDDEEENEEDEEEEEQSSSKRRK